MIEIPSTASRCNFETIRDAIFVILRDEFAELSGETPEVYRERQMPWSLAAVQPRPIVNVTFEGVSFDRGGYSTRSTQHKADGQFAVTAFAYAPSVGIDSGDEVSALRAQQAAGLAYKILMHPKYDTLGLPQNVVGTRFPSNISVLTQYLDEASAAQLITCARFSLDVTSVETPDLLDQSIVSEGVDVTDDIRSLNNDA